MWVNIIYINRLQYQRVYCTLSVLSSMKGMHGICQRKYFENIYFIACSGHCVYVMVTMYFLAAFVDFWCFECYKYVNRFSSALEHWLCYTVIQ